MASGRVPKTNITFFMLNMLFYTTEMDIKLVKMLQKGTQGRAFRHLCKGIDILGEAFTTITKLTIRSRYVGMSIVDIAG